MRLSSLVHVYAGALCVWFAYFFFFFNDTATTEIYTLSLHDALPICTRTLARRMPVVLASAHWTEEEVALARDLGAAADRKSTRLNSSHLVISYAVFCLKKKKKVTKIDSLAVLVLYAT